MTPPYVPAPTRTGLQKTRDVALTVMAVLVSISCVVMLYYAIAVGSALARIGSNLPGSGVTNEQQNNDPDPSPWPTGSNGVPCVGEEPEPGC